jgi:hypothetical protein
MNANYEWIRFYEAAVLETNSEVLPDRIETAQNAIGRRVVSSAIDEAERRAVVRTLHALATLKRERRTGRICCQCLDAHDVVTPLNGQSFLARSALGESIVTLHTRCAIDWADRNNFKTLTPLRRLSHQR